MGWKENLFQAVHELIGTGTDEPVDGLEGNRRPMKDLMTELESSGAAVNCGDAVSEGPTVAEDVASPPPPVDVEPGNDEAIPMPPSLAAPRRKTVIAEGTVVRGPIEAAGGVELYGEMQGDLTSAEEILLSGKLIGASTSRSMEMCSGRMRGDVTAAGLVQIDEESILLGDVKAAEVHLGGKIRGDLDIQNVVTLDRRAVILGNITAHGLSVAEGASLQGELRIAARDITAEFQDEQL